MASLGLVSFNSFHDSVFIKRPLLSHTNFEAASNRDFWLVRWAETKTSIAFLNDKFFSKWNLHNKNNSRTLYFSEICNKRVSINFSSTILQGNLLRGIFNWSGSAHSVVYICQTNLDNSLSSNLYSVQLIPLLQTILAIYIIQKICFLKKKLMYKKTAILNHFVSL